VFLLRIVYPEAKVARSQHLKQAMAKNLADLHSFVGTGPDNRRLAALVTNFPDISSSLHSKFDTDARKQSTAAHSF
jgi:hypothetical protein